MPCVCVHGFKAKESRLPSLIHDPYFIKNHYSRWWKIHRIFDELDILTDYDGPVLILEEDHYVAPDFLPVLKLMLALKQKV